MGPAVRSIRATALLALAASCSAPPGGPARIDNVLLVSIDTCRADRLSSYGFPRETTPHLDALAAAGVRFSRALSPFPLTLPAHASLLSGTNPPSHGVRDNATYRLAPESVTLAESLRERGMATGAVVSAFVLDSRFGLDQGFDSYDDVPDDPLTTNVIAERRGGEATRKALAWLGVHAARPFFLFLHYYDPHMFYDPPEPFASRFAGDPYAGEIAYVDAGVGEVVSELQRLGVFERTLIVVTSDHGEMLSEHGEVTHGWFVYEGALHVPLILRAPGATPAVVDGPVGLIDVAPTILGLLGAPVPPQMQGLDLSPVVRGQASPDASRELYAESMEPSRYGCNPLLALVGERFKYVLTTRPELYDVVADPGEAHDLVAQDPGRASAMRERLLARLEEPSGAAAALDPAALRRIEALGYFAGGEPIRSLVEPGRDDPKDLLSFHLAHLSIASLIVHGELAEARRRCLQLVAERPAFQDAHLLLARIARDEGRMDEAIAEYERALRLGPQTAGVHADLGVVLSRSGRREEAIGEYERALALDPERVEALNNLGNVLFAGGRTEEALARYLRAVELRPDSAETQLNAGLALLRLGRREEALLHLSRAQDAGSKDPAIVERLTAALTVASRP